MFDACIMHIPHFFYNEIWLITVLVPNFLSKNTIIEMQSTMKNIETFYDRAIFAIAFFSQVATGNCNPVMVSVVTFLTHVLNY